MRITLLVAILLGTAGCSGTQSVLRPAPARAARVPQVTIRPTPRERHRALAVQEDARAALARTTIRGGLVR